MNPEEAARRLPYGASSPGEHAGGGDKTAIFPRNRKYIYSCSSMSIRRFPLSLSLSLSLVSKEAISSDGDKVSATRSPRIIEGRFSFRGDARCGALNWREDVSLARAR